MANEISEQDRSRLLDLARQAVLSAVAQGPRPRVDEPDGVLSLQRGCFVTLTNRGQLRGCIGTFRPYKPLGEQVIDMGIEAANDPRFIYDAIRPAEVPHLTVAVSVLSELTPIANPLDIQLGVHGIYIVRGRAAGCFLPEVVTETGWSKEEFLSHCCAGKAGMSADAWKQPLTQVLVFTTEKFSDGPE
jgi:AmmeMemoRadiSam system protein A